MNDEVMKKAFAELSKEQISFICDEFAITEDDIKAKSEDELNDLYESLCDIECEETPSDGGELTERGEMSASIVTVVGNYFSKEYGYDDDEEFEKFLSEEDDE